MDLPAEIVDPSWIRHVTEDPCPHQDKGHCDACIQEHVEVYRRNNAPPHDP